MLSAAWELGIQNIDYAPCKKGTSKLGVDPVDGDTFVALDIPIHDPPRDPLREALRRRVIDERTRNVCCSSSAPVSANVFDDHAYKFTRIGTRGNRT